MYNEVHKSAMKCVAEEKVNYNKVCSVLLIEGILTFGGPLQIKAVVVYLVYIPQVNW